jgi:integrase/recombinase XerC
MKSAIEAWAAWQLEGQHLAVTSVTAYKSQLSQVLDLMPPPDVVKATDLRAVLKHARARGLSDSSVDLLLAALKSFYRWATDNSIPAAFKDFGRKRRPRRLPRPLTEDQCFELLSCCARRGDWLGLRNEALWTLLWATGLRVSEALSLTIAVAGNRPSSLRITGKGNKERVVPVLPDVWHAIDAYLVAMPYAHLSDCSPLFVTNEGNPLTDRDVRRAFEADTQDMGLPDSATPHSLRHSFATHMLNAGASLIDIKELLGHESVSTTAIYTQVAVERLLEQYDMAHPRAQALAPQPAIQSVTI